MFHRISCIVLMVKLFPSPFPEKRKKIVWPIYIILLLAMRLIMLSYQTHIIFHDRHAAQSPTECTCHGSRLHNIQIAQYLTIIILYCILVVHVHILTKELKEECVHLYRGTLKNLTVFFIITTFLAIVVFAAHHSLPWYICIYACYYIACHGPDTQCHACMHACIHSCTHNV